jgi:hypothetical protein
MILNSGIFLLKQTAALSVLLSLPFLWLLLAGKSDVVENLMNGSNFVEIITSFLSVSLKDTMHATGITAIVGGSVYSCIGLSFSVFHIPVIGPIDRVIAKTFIIFGLGILLLAYKLDLYS